VHTGVCGKLRVEGGGHDSALADGDGVVVIALGGDDFDARAEALDLGGADPPTGLREPRFWSLRTSISKRRRVTSRLSFCRGSRGDVDPFVD
jgi:hypothetical protein